MVQFEGGDRRMSFLQKHMPVYNYKWKQFKELTSPASCHRVHRGLHTDCESCFDTSPELPPCRWDPADIAAATERLKAQTEYARAMHDYREVATS